MLSDDRKIRRALLRYCTGCRQKAFSYRDHEWFFFSVYAESPSKHVVLRGPFRTIRYGPQYDLSPEELSKDPDGVDKLKRVMDMILVEEIMDG